MERMHQGDGGDEEAEDDGEDSEVRQRRRTDIARGLQERAADADRPRDDGDQPRDRGPAHRRQTQQTGGEEEHEEREDIDPATGDEDFVPEVAVGGRALVRGGVAGEERRGEDQQAQRPVEAGVDGVRPADAGGDLLNSDAVLGHDSRLSFVHGVHCRLLSRSSQLVLSAVEPQPVPGSNASATQPMADNTAETTNAQRNSMSIAVLQSRTSRVWSSSFAN